MHSVKSVVVVALMLLATVGAAETWQEDGYSLAHSNSVNDVEWTPNGSVIASSSDSGSSFKMHSMPEIGEFRSSINNVKSLAFSPNSSLLAYGVGTGAYIYYIEGGAWSFQTSLSSSGTVWDLSFSPDGSILAVAGSSQVHVFSTSSWSETSTPNGISGAVRSVDFSPNGSYLAAGSGDKQVTVWNTTNWGSVHSNTYTASGTGIGSVQFNSNGSSLFLGRWDTTIRVLETVSWSETTSLSSFEGYFDLSSTGKIAYTTGSSNTVVVYNTTTWSLLDTVSPGARASDVVFSPNGSMLLVSLDNGTLMLYSVDSDDDGLKDWDDDCPYQHGTSTIDLDGCPDQDGDGYSNGGDDFPSDPTQWADPDGDGYGSNPNGSNPDGCPSEWGNSTQPVEGCPDQDGDGWADYADNCPTEWGDNVSNPGCPDDPPVDPDTDGDGYNDSVDDCPTVAGNSTIDQTGCPDSDGDGYSDTGDAFPADPGEWVDSDGDGLGDNSDGCPLVAGSSIWPRAGCPDTDGDGWENGDDAFPNDPNEWNDTDSDGYGDNSDECSDQFGTSTWPRLGCPDSDSDGVEDTFDAFPFDPTETNDTDSDGVGDNSDECPLQWGNLSNGCPWEDPGGNGTNNGTNNTNGTNNNTNGTGNNTNPNGTNNETNNGTDPGANVTDGNGTNTTGGNSSDLNDTTELNPGPRVLGMSLPTVFVLFSVVAALILVVLIATTKSRRGTGPPRQKGSKHWGREVPAPISDGDRVLPDSHPTLVVDELPDMEEELDWGDAPAPVQEQKPLPAHLHVLESEATFEEQMETIAASVKPYHDEANREPLRQLKELEARIRSVHADGDMARRRFEKLMKEIDQRKRGVEALTPLRI